VEFENPAVVANYRHNSTYEQLKNFKSLQLLYWFPSAEKLRAKAENAAGLCVG
jgi:hypothetical protein